MAERLRGHPSPYLEQHADNPVDWWPWCDEAFEEARRRDVPVFLSIGYATCHWCHVMAHESFEDDGVAALLNDHFVCIKVDREERPDLDEAYMAVCQAMNGSGGWPLTAVLDHDARPWFTGTYFPKTGRGQRPGMMELVPHLSQVWRDRRDDVLHSAGHILEHVQAAAHTAGAVPDGLLAKAAADLERRFEAEHGGFGKAPKFPSPHQVTALLAEGSDASRRMAVHTLDAMAAGGIHDHVGGGFHRYSTDRRWLLPHFEKMLYDQATLLDAYTKAWQATREPRYEAVARGIVAYVLRDLSHPDGPAFCGEDADSEGEEGTFYVWDHDDLVRHAGKEFAAAFGATPKGNFHDEATGQPDPRNILHAPPGTDTSRWKARFDALRNVRGQLPRPLRDEKVLTAWNGLWIDALARAAMAFDEPAWLDQASRAARFLLDHMHDGHLRHRWRDGAVDDDAFLDDHAFFGRALVTLFEATGDAAWLDPARRIAADLVERFGHEGAFTTAPKDGFGLVRRTDAYDGAMPSGNSVAIDFLGRLGRITGETGWLDAAWRCAEAFGREAGEHPAAFTALIQAIEGLRGREVVVTDDGLWREAWAALAPDAVRIRRGDVATGIDWIDAHDPSVAAAYVCRDHACQAPVHDAEALRQSLA